MIDKTDMYKTEIIPLLLLVSFVVSRLMECTMSFENKVVLVTGASSGIGAATAVLFAEKGAKVAIVGRNEVKLSKVVNDFVKKGLLKPLVIKADISKDGDASEIVKKTVKTFGKLDILVNNAGLVKFGTILEGNIMDTYDEIMAVNMRAQVYITSLATPHLIKTKGSIINISSVGALCVPEIPTFSIYHASKAALNMFTRTTAKELASHGVRVNSVSPGPVKTDIMENAGSSISVEDFTTPLGRVSESIEVAELIMYLASDKAVAITGADFVTDNGYLLKR